MKLRILRVWYDELAVPMTQVRYGGVNPTKRKAHDTLQYQVDPNCEWENVPIVEEPVHE